MIRSILFKGTLAGNGIVNFDSTDQRWLLKERFPSERSFLSHDNVKIAKHNFYKVGEADGKPIWDRKLCISADCLRQAIFGDDFSFQNTSVMHHPELLLQVLASAPALLRGYMFAEEGKTALKRKSPVMITAAEQTSTGMTHFEIGTMSGAKRTKVDEDSASDTSMHYEEKSGPVEYAFEGALDLKDLQFVSLSEVYDRLAVNPDQCDKYRDILGRLFKSTISPKRFYVMRTAVIRTPEEGILFTKEQVTHLVSEFFRRLLVLSIQRSKGYAQLKELKVKLVANPLQDTFEDEGGWRKLSSPDDLPLKPADIDLLYDVVPDEEAKRLDQAVKAGVTEQAKKKKDAAEATKKARANAKKSANP